MPNPYSKEEINRSKSASIKDGAFWAISLGSGEASVQPFVVGLLNAGLDFTILLTAVPPFIGSLAQFIATPALTHLRSRRLFSTFVLMLQALTWLCMAYLAVSGQPWAALAAVLVFTIYQVFNLLISPVWNVWMSEIVEHAERGYYFALRNRIIVLLQLSVSLIAGWLLLQSYVPIPLLFAGIFFVAFASRMVSGYFLGQMADHPAAVEPHESRLDLKTFITHPSYAEERHFSLYIFLLLTATYLSSCFYAFYLLSVLHVDYFAFFLVILAAPLAKFLTFPYWGRINDRYGTRALLYVSGLLVPLGPLIWFFTQNVGMLIFAEFIAGIAWSGFDLATFNYLLSHPNPGVRLTMSSVYTLGRGAGILLGSLIALLLFTVWPQAGIIGLGFFAAFFLLSALTRLLVSLSFLPLFSKTAFERQMQSNEFMFEVLAMRPTRDLSRNLVSTSVTGLHHAQSSMDFSRRMAQQGFERTVRLLRPMKKH